MLVSHNSTGNEDTELLQGLKSGDAKSFRALFKKYSKRLFFVAFQYLNDKDESEEIVQEVFLKIWINRQNINPELQFVPYIKTIAKNLIINKAKRKLLETTYIKSLENGDHNYISETENHTHFQEIQELINQQIDHFPTRRKEVFILSREKGLSIKEIAERLGISESTVENHINKAIKDLKKQLQNTGYLNIILFLLYANVL